MLIAGIVFLTIWYLLTFFLSRKNTGEGKRSSVQEERLHLRKNELETGRAPVSSSFFRVLFQE
jgi:hypothetical protein